MERERGRVSRSIVGDWSPATKITAGVALDPHSAFGVYAGEEQPEWRANNGQDLYGTYASLNGLHVIHVKLK